MTAPTHGQAHFTRAKAVLSAIGGLSSVKLLLALVANSRPRTKPLAHSLLKLLAPGSCVSYTYKICDKTLQGFLRWKHIDSDLQSALELAIGDIYRTNQLPQPDFIIDGGANTGLFTLAARTRWPNVPIVAFEPVPANVAAIESHLQANHCQNGIKIENAALAGFDGTKRFYIREANQGSLTGDLPSTDILDVNCRALAQYLPQDPNLLKLIKLDIEGGEVEVLDALFQNGGTKKTIIVMELHSTPVTRPWIEALAHRIGYGIEFYQIGGVTAHCQLTSPDLH